MAKTWENYECEFYTENSTNNLGNSKYLVLKNKMTRTAFVNLRRAPSQVRAESPAIAYLNSNDKLFSIIMNQTDDSKIKIDNVVNDTITVSVEVGSNLFIGTCSRKPANGLVTFDFVNEDGNLSLIHVGHEVKMLRLGHAKVNDDFDLKLIKQY